jgi:hypothetical protein
MDAQYQYIISLAKQYQHYSDRTDELLNVINSLSEEVIKDIYHEYGDTNSKLQPVNLLRAEIARQLLKGEKINEQLIDEIKNHIRNKNREYFHFLPEKVFQQLIDYPTKEKDMFVNWQKYWYILFPFFYRGTEKDTTRLYLDQISKRLLTDLNIPDYTYTQFDFYGPNNYGSERCWIALYPENKNSHKDAYQFFVNLSAYPQAGRVTGFSIKERKENLLKNVSSYTEIFSYLEELKPEIIHLNKDLRNYFKYSPGKQASEWGIFYYQNEMAINFNHLSIRDLSRYNSLAEINIACGFPSEKDSNETWNLWLFKSANIGDLVFVSKGVNTCVGIGIIESPYYYEESQNKYNHKRNVRWITNKVYQYKPNSKKGYKFLFRFDTFSPTKVWNFLLNEYVRIYPELANVLYDNSISYNKMIINKVEDRIQLVEFPSVEEFIKISNLQTTGDGITSEASSFKKNNEMIFNKLQIELSFGIGGATNVPYIAFIGYNQVVSNGIYPVLLYYKDINLLILAYGVSSKNNSEKKWSNYHELKTINSYFDENNLGNPPKYGNSCIYKVYNTNLLINQREVEKDTFDLTNYYHRCLEPIIDDEIQIGKIDEPINFWWLNANPKIWRISSYSEGQTQTYTTHNERNNKRRVYKFFETVKPGDLVIGYESTPTRQIKAILEITKRIHTTEEGEVIEFQISEILEYPINWNELKNNPALKDCEVFINNQGSLFSLTEEEYDIIREIIDEKNIVAEKVIESNIIKEYNFSQDPDKPFMKEEKFKQIVSLLKHKKNIILQGSPGVGKTFIAKKIAYEIMRETNDLCIEMVQFHQSYSYEDFIQGIRPSENEKFELRNGIFYSFCQRAVAHPEKPYFFIIDEINRGNLGKIFGELMMLIEADKRGDKWSLKLTYSDDDMRFFVPENLYIIGTMNTADRSLAIVDYALRRRFAFVTLQPDYNDSFKQFMTQRGFLQNFIDHIVMQINKVNDEIKNDPNLGEGFQIGHSYFCTHLNGNNEHQWWKEIIDFEIKPLLEEIWFDDLSKAKKMIDILNFQ